MILKAGDIEWSTIDCDSKEMFYVAKKSYSEAYYSIREGKGGFSFLKTVGPSSKVDGRNNLTCKIPLEFEYFYGFAYQSGKVTVIAELVSDKSNKDAKPTINITLEDLQIVPGGNILTDKDFIKQELDK